MKQELDTHAAELQRIADQLTAVHNDPPSRKKRDKLVATIAPALQLAAAKAQRLREIYKANSCATEGAITDNDGGPRLNQATTMVQRASMVAAESSAPAGDMCLDCGYMQASACLPCM